MLDFAGEIEINKIRSFTQRKDLVVKRLGSWGVWLLAGKANVCFLGPILRQSPRLYLTGFTCAQPVWNSFSEGRCCQSFSSLWLVMFFVSVHSWPRYLQSEVSLCVDLVWDLLQMPLRRSLYGWGRRREKPWRHFSLTLTQCLLLSYSQLFPPLPRPQESFVWGPPTVRPPPYLH